MEKQIIAIRRIDIQRANEAFAKLMSDTEARLNKASHINPTFFKNLTPSQLEQESCEIIKEACCDSPFNPEKVILVSGHSFPDIVAESYYGIEVKSTKANHWTSTGSSIVESTRDKLIDNVYMLFGKLGGDPPEFRCRPYSDVLSDIAVTHSPRYLINMQLKDGETIFDKMNTTYDEFRTTEDNIAKVRSYYRGKVQKGQEMPWWISSDDIDRPIGFTLKMWNSIHEDEKKRLTAFCLILFPEIWTPGANARTKYSQAALWLCSYAQVLCPNVRDIFSAGGQIKYVNGKQLAVPIPQVFKTIAYHMTEIRGILDYPSRETIELIRDFNEELLNKNSGSLFMSWLQLLQEKVGNYIGMRLKEWISMRFLPNLS